MALTLVADFDTRAKAILAVENLSSAGIRREHIATYPNVSAHELNEPHAGENVSGSPATQSTDAARSPEGANVSDESEIAPSNDGILARFQTLLTNLFNAGIPPVDAVIVDTESGNEPMQEIAGRESVFLAVDVSADPSIAKAAYGILETAGASRIELHEVDA